MPKNTNFNDLESIIQSEKEETSKFLSQTQTIYKYIIETVGGMTFHQLLKKIEIEGDELKRVLGYLLNHDRIVMMGRDRYVSATRTEARKDLMRKVASSFDSASLKRLVDKMTKESDSTQEDI